MWVSHDVWGAGHLGSTLSQKRIEEQRRRPAESRAPCRSRIGRPGYAAHSAAKSFSLAPGFFYPRLQPSSTSTTAIKTSALSSFSVNFLNKSVKSPGTLGLSRRGGSHFFSGRYPAGNSCEMLASSTDFLFPTSSLKPYGCSLECQASE